MNPLEIKAARTRLGYTQAEIAEKLGMKEGTYQKKESGKLVFRVHQALSLGKILGMTEEQINEFIMPDIYRLETISNSTVKE